MAMALIGSYVSVLVPIGTVSEGIGGVAMLEEVCHRDRFVVPKDWYHSWSLPPSCMGLRGELTAIPAPPS